MCHVPFASQVVKIEFPGVVPTPRPGEPVRMDAEPLEVPRYTHKYIKRRDLLKLYRLQPRDLRRIDPSLAVTKASAPTMFVKENVMILSFGGVRCVSGRSDTISTALGAAATRARLCGPTCFPSDRLQHRRALLQLDSKLSGCTLLKVTTSWLKR